MAPKGRRAANAENCDRSRQEFLAGVPEAFRAGCRLPRAMGGDCSVRCDRGMADDLVVDRPDRPVARRAHRDRDGTFPLHQRGGRPRSSASPARPGGRGGGRASRTAVADNPQLTVRRVAGPIPHASSSIRSGRLPPDARLLRDDGCRSASRDQRTTPSLPITGGGRNDRSSLPRRPHRAGGHSDCVGASAAFVAS